MKHSKTTSILLAAPMVALGWCAPLTAIGAPDQTVTAPTSSPQQMAEQCMPACRAGYLCVQGQCVSSCNPPCSANETCTATGQCIVAAPAAVTVAPSPITQTSQVGPAQSGNVAPAAQSNNVPVPFPAEPIEPEKEPVPARRFGKGFQIAISAENLFGYVHGWDNWSITKSSGVSVSGQSVSNTRDTFAFLGNTGNASVNPHLGIDIVLDQGVTLGGAFLYASTSGNWTTTQGTGTSMQTNGKNPGVTGFGIEARAGYVLMFNDVVGVWPRLGLVYQSGTQTGYTYTYSGTNNQTQKETKTEVDVDVFSIQPEVMLVVAPIAHFALIFGAGANVGLTGSQTRKQAGTTNYDGDYKNYGIGLSAGLMGYL